MLDQNRYWNTVKYTKLLQFKIIPALKNLDGNVATSIKAKKVIFCRSAFTKPPISLGLEPPVLPGVAYIGVTEVKIAHTLMSQLTTKAFGLDKINFRIYA